MSSIGAAKSMQRSVSRRGGGMYAGFGDFQAAFDPDVEAEEEVWNLGPRLCVSQMRIFTIKRIQ